MNRFPLLVPIAKLSELLAQTAQMPTSLYKLQFLPDQLPWAHTDVEKVGAFCVYIPESNQTAVLRHYSQNITFAVPWYSYNFSRRIIWANFACTYVEKSSVSNTTPFLSYRWTQFDSRSESTPVTANAVPVGLQANWGTKETSLVSVWRNIC